MGVEKRKATPAPPRRNGRKGANGHQPASVTDHMYRRLDQLTDAKRKVVSYILEHSEEILFMTVNQLSEAAGVDPATVVRTAQTLGYVGYPELQDGLRREFLNRTTPLKIMQSHAEAGGDGWDVIDQDIENLYMLRKNLDKERLAQLVERLFRAPKIVVVGLDLASTLSFYFGYLLETLQLPAVTVTAGGGHLRNQLMSLNEGSLLVGISFRRCLRETVNAVKTARERGAFTACVTDSFASPLTRFSDMCFLTPINSASYANSYAAPISLLNTIVVACARADKRRSLNILKDIEKEYQEGDRWY
jgi:DNA-binding MurR/RpiR family transcriptional regulator